MLNYLLGWTVGLGSLGFYLSGYLLPEVRRKNDAIWSGIGLIYALALLVNGSRITPGLFIGQLASTTLIGWFGWQVIQQRRQMTAPTEQTSIPSSVQTVFPFLKQGWQHLVTAYTEPEHSDSDVLISGVKKVSSLIGGNSERSSSVDLPDRFKTDSAPADLDEDWSEVTQPSATVADTPEDSETAVELPDRFKSDTPADVISESSEPTAVQEPQTVEPTMPTPSESNSPSPSPVPDSPATVDVVDVTPTADLEPEPAVEVPLPSEPTSEPTSEAASDHVSSNEEQEVHPTAEIEIEEVDVLASEQKQSQSEAEIESSTQESETHPDFSEPSQKSSPSGENGEEDWPPKDSMV